MTTISQTIRWMDANHGWCIDRDNRYGAQAPDLVNAYAGDLYDLPHVLGNGKDMAANLAQLGEYVIQTTSLSRLIPGTWKVGDQ